MAEVENKARKWMVKSEPSGSVMGIVKFGNELMLFSHLLLFFSSVSFDGVVVCGWVREEDTSHRLFPSVSLL